MPEVAIYQDIDSATGFGPQMLRDAIALANGEPLTIRINSQGGNVIDGLACYNLLKQYPGAKTAIIDGMALSIASVIPLACDQIQIAENSWMMIHNPNNEAHGDGDDMREMATLLDGMRDQLAAIYAAKSGKPADDCKALMAAETWYTGPQAVEAGFADTLISPTAAAASFDAARFSNPPKLMEQKPMPATFTELKKAFPKAKADFIVRCQERSLDLDAARNEYEEDMAKALEQTQEELAAARAELEEMKEAAAKAKAKAEEEEAAAAKAKAMEEEEQAAAKAKARGVKPAASTATAKGGQSATARWHAAIEAKVAAGLPKAKAVRAVMLEDPDLQQDYLAEANA